jgi:hypothetical protein
MCRYDEQFSPSGGPFVDTKKSCFHAAKRSDMVCAIFLLVDLLNLRCRVIRVRNVQVYPVQSCKVVELLMFSNLC